jgi:hypothetical protein
MPHSSSLGSVGHPGRAPLAHVAGDPLGVVRLAGQQFGNRRLDLLGVGGTLVIQQGGRIGAVEQVGGVGQAAIGVSRSQPGVHPTRW